MRQRDPITSRFWFVLMLGSIIGAITLWPMSYSQLNKSASPIALGWGVFCVIAGLYLGIVSKQMTSKIALHLSGGVAVALVIRIAVDVAINPNHHNVWPFEFAWLMIVCFPSALAGAWAGRRIASRQG